MQPLLLNTYGYWGGGGEQDIQAGNRQLAPSATRAYDNNPYYEPVNLSLDDYFRSSSLVDPTTLNDPAYSTEAGSWGGPQKYWDEFSAENLSKGISPGTSTGYTDWLASKLGTTKQDIINNWDQYSGLFSPGTGGQGEYPYTATYDPSSGRVTAYQTSPLAYEGGDSFWKMPVMMGAAILGGGAMGGAFGGAGAGAAGADEAIAGLTGSGVATGDATALGGLGGSSLAGADLTSPELTNFIDGVAPGETTTSMLGGSPFELTSPELTNFIDGVSPGETSASMLGGSASSPLADVANYASKAKSTLDQVEKWTKDHPFLTKAGLGLGSSVLQAIGNQSLAKKNQQNTQALLDQQAKDRAAYNNPTLDPRFNAAGLQPRVALGTNPLSMYGNNTNEMLMTKPLNAAKGGLSMVSDIVSKKPARMVHGANGGQEDDVPAMLSSSEYVMDADTVAALGDGNPEAGARKLDEFRRRLRMHKRSAPAHKIPPKTKPVESYMRRAA